MPLLCDEATTFTKVQQDPVPGSPRVHSVRRQSQHSTIAKTAILSSCAKTMPEFTKGSEPVEGMKENGVPAKVRNGTLGVTQQNPKQSSMSMALNGAALTDTPATTAPNSPRMWVRSCKLVPHSD